jgi:hypothetical protein
MEDNVFVNNTVTVKASGRIRSRYRGLCVAALSTECSYKPPARDRHVTAESRLPTWAIRQLPVLSGQPVLLNCDSQLSRTINQVKKMGIDFEEPLF